MSPSFVVVLKNPVIPFVVPVKFELMACAAGPTFRFRIRVAQSENIRPPLRSVGALVIKVLCLCLA